MKDPCKANKAASRRSLRKLDLYKAVTLSLLAAFTLVLAASPSLANRLNFVGPVLDDFRSADVPDVPDLPSLGDDDGSADDVGGAGAGDSTGEGRLVVRVAPFEASNVVGSPGQSEVSGQVTVLDSNDQVVATDVVGSEFDLVPGTYTVMVETDAPTDLPPKLVDIEADTLHDVVFEYREPLEVVEEAQDGALLVTLFTYDAEFVVEPLIPEDIVSVFVRDQAGGIVATGEVGAQLSLPPGTYTVETDAGTPSRVVQITAGALSETAFVVQEPETVEPDPNGILIVSLVAVGPDGQIVEPDEPLLVTVFDAVNEPVAEGFVDSEIVLAPGRYTAMVLGRPSGTYVYVEPGTTTRIEYVIQL